MTTAPLTTVIANEPHQPPRARCPICGDRIVYSIRNGTRILDYHHDKRAGYIRWCSGSEMVIDEAKK